MKLKIKNGQIVIPVGWRKLRKGTKLRGADRFASLNYGLWILTMLADYQVGRIKATEFTYIRRIAKKS